MILINKVGGFRSVAINALIDAVHSLRPVPGPGLRVQETPSGSVLSLDPRSPMVRGWPYGSVYAFGLGIAGAVVTVYPGTLQASGLVYTTAETTITITSAGQYVGLALARITGTLTVTGPHNTRPVSSGEVWRTALYVFDFADGVATLSRECIHDIRLEVAL